MLISRVVAILGESSDVRRKRGEPRDLYVKRLAVAPKASEHRQR